ncbi:hypothetical protein HJG60_012137 [Phyllostomus discolor]|uniref:Uncharacterized protein n=1 Tax=Phyllostomus discolor TaxID=89673 RepID=A0A834DT73_9CHIR|nr:hypothetical protein HJG60_012137 [Phyllostomus discolor]
MEMHFVPGEGPWRADARDMPTAGGRPSDSPLGAKKRNPRDRSRRADGRTANALAAPPQARAVPAQSGVQRAFLQKPCVSRGGAGTEHRRRQRNHSQTHSTPAERVARSKPVKYFTDTHCASSPFSPWAFSLEMQIVRGGGGGGPRLFSLAFSH